MHIRVVAHLFFLLNHILIENLAKLSSKFKAICRQAKFKQVFPYSVVKR